MDLGIRGKTALVCAASKGLGKGCAVALAREGVNLVITARGADALEATAAEIRKLGVKVTAVAGDITTPEGRAAALKACPSPDILVNNAGGPPPGDFREWERDAWVKALDANMITPILLIRAVVDGMIARKFGRVVNITSGRGQGADRRARPVQRRAHRPHRLHRRRVAHHRAPQRHHQQPAARPVRDRPAALQPGIQREEDRQDRRRASQGAYRRQPRRAASAPSRSSATPAPFCAARKRASSPDKTSSWTVASTRARSRISILWRRTHETRLRTRRLAGVRGLGVRAGLSEPCGQSRRALAARTGDRHRGARGRGEAAGGARPAFRDRQQARRRRLDRHGRRSRRARPTATRCSPPPAGRSRSCRTCRGRPTTRSRISRR